MSWPILPLILAALVGAAFGMVYLGLLWGAVSALPKDRGGVWVFVGLGLVRMVLVLGAVATAVVLGLRIEAIATALAGFIALRLAATRWIGPPPSERATWK